MRYLVDTHVLIWALNDPSRINRAIVKLFSNATNEIYFSQISLWEISIKYGLGKLDLLGHTPEEFYQACASSLFQSLPLDNVDLASSYNLPLRHRDPFDRMIVWQSIREDLVLITADRSLDVYRADGLQLIVNE